MATQTDTREWRAVQGFPFYEVSRCGCVRSLPRVCRTKSNGIKPLRGQELRPIRHLNEYLFVTLNNNGSKKIRSIHSLVLEAFGGPKPTERHQVRHLDGNRQNNHANNLAWGTPKENAADTVRHGRTLRGQRNPNSKYLPEQKEAAAVLLRTGKSQTLVAKLTGVERCTVNDIALSLRRHAP